MEAATFKLIINWSDDDQCYAVKVPDLPGCMAHGETRQQGREDGGGGD